MTGPAVALEPSSPWTIRLLERSPLPFPVTAVALGLASYGVFCGVSGLFGSRVGHFAEFAVETQLGAELLLGMMIGFAPALTLVSIRGALRDVEELRPLLACDDADFERLRAGLRRYPSGLLRALGGATALAAAAFVMLEPELWRDGQRPPAGNVAFLWLLLRNMVNFWLVGRALGFELVSARAFSRLGDALDAAAVLERRPLTPFARRGLRGVLGWMLFLAFYSLLFLEGWAADATTWVMVVMACFALAAFVLPMLGAHRRIAALKRGELERLRGEIGRLQPDATAPPGRLADLIAYEARVEGIREWPFGAPSLLRFALYLSLGLGSWIGAALVERLLDQTLR